MEGNCDDPDRICRLKECIAFFRSRGARFVYTRHNVRPHDANEVIGRAYDIIEEQSDVVVHMGRYSLDEFAAKHADSRNVIILILLSVHIQGGHQRGTCAPVS